MRNDGGVELSLGTFPEKLEMLKTDEEFPNTQSSAMAADVALSTCQISVYVHR